jgi:hypothetical protein
VLCAYEAAAAAGEAEEFCAANFLHARHLREMSQLRQQLGRTLLQLQQQQGKASGQQGLSLAHFPGIQQQDQQQQGGSSSSSSGEQTSALQLLQLLMAAVEQVGAEKLTQPLPEPSARTLEVLRRALAAGWCDQVGRVLQESLLHRRRRKGKQHRISATEAVHQHLGVCAEKTHRSVLQAIGARDNTAPSPLPGMRMLRTGVSPGALSRLCGTPGTERQARPPRSALQPSLPGRRSVPAPAQLPGQDGTRVCGVRGHCAHCEATLHGACDSN